MMWGIILFFASSMAMDDITEPSTILQTTNAPVGIVWHPVTDGFIGVSGKDSTMPSLAAHYHCMRWGSNLLEMPNSTIRHDVRTVLSRLAVSKTEKFWVGSTNKEHSAPNFKWDLDGSDVDGDETFWDDESSPWCLAWKTFYTSLQEGRLRMCTQSGEIHLRFICHKYAAGERLANLVEGTTKTPITEDIPVDVDNPAYGSNHDYIWLSNEDERENLTTAGKTCCKLTDSKKSPSVVLYELLELHNNTVYKHVSGILERELGSIKIPVETDKMFWLGAGVAVGSEHEYRWWVDDNVVPKTWFSKSVSCNGKSEDGALVAAIMENDKLRLCKVHPGTKLRFMCMGNDNDNLRPMHEVAWRSEPVTCWRS